MNILPKMTGPVDLRDVADGPRKQSPKWAIVGDAVELEASNARCGIWWRTTLDRLPAKVL